MDSNVMQQGAKSALQATVLGGGAAGDGEAPEAVIGGGLLPIPLPPPVPAAEAAAAPQQQHGLAGEQPAGGAQAAGLMRMASMHMAPSPMDLKVS